MGYNGYTDKKKETNKRYIENNKIARVVLNIPEEEKKKVFDAANRSGKSVNSYIMEAVNEKIKKSAEIE